MKPMKRVSKPRQLENMANWHEKEEERHEKEEERRREVKKKLKTAAAKKRPRPTGARGGSKSEPAKKKHKVDNDGDDGDGSHESTPRAHSDGRAKRKEAGKRVPVRGKGAAKGKKVEVKIETPAVPSREETPVAPPTVNESTANSKRKKPQQRETQTEPVPVEKEVFERTIPIEHYSSRAVEGARTPTGINVTMLLVQFSMEEDTAHEKWLPATKQHFLTSMSNVGKAHLLLDLSNVDAYDIERYDFDDENPDLAVIHGRAIEEQVEQLREEHPQSKVVLVGWGSSCLATLGALPNVADHLACVINIAFYESEIRKFYEKPESLNKVSEYNVPILFIVGAGGEKGQIAVDAVEELRTRLSVPTGTIAVERVNEELLVPVHMLRSATSSQSLVQERIISNVADFIKEMLQAQKKTKEKRAQSASAGNKKKGGK